MLSPLLAVLAAVANGLASVLQRKAARTQPTSENLSWRLSWHLLHQPVWFAGILAIIAGFLLQAAALGVGRISVVEPVLVLELPATLMIAALVFRTRLTSREWGAAVAMSAGLAALLYALAPSGGSSTQVAWLLWCVAITANLALVAVAVGLAVPRPAGVRRAAILGVATGCMFGLTSALMKGMADQFAHGVLAVLQGWQFYGMIVSGLVSVFLLQSAMNAGRLLATQPGLTLVDPIVAVLWGVFVFQERVRGGPYILLAVAGALLIAVSVVVLAHSPLLNSRSTEESSGRASED